ncbi:MAG: hypothetical protein H0Z53_00800 [Nitrosospira sp.]|nr:hypothetical protein [Nitrosospira sp.]
MIYYKDLTTNEVYGYDETEESQLPYIQQSIDNGWENVTGSYPPPPLPPTAEQNQQKASGLLYNTDWTTISDIGLPTASPRLANQAEFIAYRQEIRQIAVYPLAGEIIWPTLPTEVWVPIPPLDEFLSVLPTQTIP